MVKVALYSRCRFRLSSHNLLATGRQAIEHRVARWRFIFLVELNCDRQLSGCDRELWHLNEPIHQFFLEVSVTRFICIGLDVDEVEEDWRAGIGGGIVVGLVTAC